MDDKTIITAILQGETEKFSLLIKRYQRPLQGFLAGCCLSKTEIRDFLHDSFVLTYQKLSQFDLQQPFWPWLKKLSLNLVREKIRQNTSHNQRLVNYLLLHSQTLEDTASEDRLQDLKLCLQDLESSQKNLLLKRYWEKASIEQLSRESGRNQGAITMQLTRIRYSLKKCLHQKL